MSLSWLLRCVYVSIHRCEYVCRVGEVISRTGGGSKLSHFEERKRFSVRRPGICNLPRWILHSYPDHSFPLFLLPIIDSLFSPVVCCLTLHFKVKYSSVEMASPCTLKHIKKWKAGRQCSIFFCIFSHAFSAVKVRESPIRHFGEMRVEDVIL